jgi:hypothetical protein
MLWLMLANMNLTQRVVSVDDFVPHRVTKDRTFSRSVSTLL